MKSTRTKNATRNIIFGIILKIYQIILPFIIRTSMIYFMGVKYLGLNSLFTSILQVLNLAELGVGSAMVYSMYKPIVEKNNEKISALMNLYKTYYKIIGIIIAIVGLMITPFVPHLINGTVPDNINIYVLYIFNLTATVLSYLMFAYKASIFQAFQRNDILSKITIITSTIQYILQFIIILFIKNYYLFVFVLIFVQILSNIITSILADKYYPEYSAKGTVSNEEKKKINSKIRDLFTSKIGSVIVNSVDTIIISAFLGLTILAIYQNYYYIISALIGILSIIYKACTAGIGNSIIIDNDIKRYNDFNVFTFLILWIVGFCSCVLLCLYQPFMNLWVGSKYLLDFKVVICIVIYFYVYELNQLFCTYKDAAGIWHKDRYRPLITAGLNLIMNLIMVNFYGIYGIVLSTIISTFFVGTPWLIINLFSTIFDYRNMKKFIIKIFKYSLISIISCVISYFLLNNFNYGEFLTIILGFIICLIIHNLMFIIVFYKTEEFRNLIKLIKKIAKREENG